MGQGTKRRPETAKAPPASALGTTDSDNESAPTDFCLRTYNLKVRLQADAKPTIGMTVRLSLGSPPRVVGDDGEIGVLQDPLAHGLGRCLLDGYRFSGAIDWIDLDGHGAAITVGGEWAG
jgi:hypothetical protein